MDAIAQLGSYSERKKFILESDSVSGSSDLTDFPVLVSVTLPAMDVTSPNGFDIAFTSADGTTQIDHQIESYNSTTGDLLAWVKFPTVSPNSDTQFFIYYGDSGITTSQDSTSTWDDNYVLVMHMNGPDTGTESDATQYGNDGTINGVGGIDTVAAQIGFGRDFERGDADFIQVADDATLDITGEITMSFWFSREDQQPDFISKGINLSYEATSRGTMRTRFNKNGANILTTPSEFTINTSDWVYIVYVQTSSGMEIYQNGVLVASNTNTTAYTTNNDPLYISRSADAVDGIMDEVRISDISRSEDWIITEYNNQLNPTTFIEELADVPGISNIESINQEYTAGGAAVFLTNTITVDSHPTISTLDSVVIQVSGNFESGGDELNFTDGTIVGTYGTTTGKLLLENNATLAAYQTAIRSVTFSSSLGSPSSSTRTVTITGYSGSDATNSLERDIDVVTVLTGLDDISTPVFYLNGLDLDGDGTLNSAEASPPTNNSAISTWGDISTNSFDFVAGTAAIFDSLAFGERGAVLFVPNDELQKTVETSISNSAFTEKTFAIIFRTGSDVSGFQMLYEQSSATRGYNFSIVDGNLYAQAFSRGDGNWGGSNAVRHRVIDLGTVETNSTYYLIAYHDNTDWTAQVNDGAFSGFTNAAEMPAVSQTSAIGGSNGNTRQPVTLASTASGNFGGLIAEIASWNAVLSGGQIQSINNYFEDTWGNTPPVLAGIEGGNIDFSEGDPDTLVTSTITISDSDPHNNLDSAQVRITTNYVSGEDSLIFSDFGNITSSFDGITGVLTLSGSDTKANYQTALRSVRYRNSTLNPTVSTRTLDFIVYDWDDSSNVVSRSINVVDLEFTPTLTSIETDTLTFTEGDSPTAITSTIVVDDFDDTNLASATISITNNFTLGEDELAFTDFGSISGSWNGTTGILSLTGSDDVADYQTALRSVTYENLSSDPIELVKTITFTVSDGTNTSTSVNRKVDVIAANSKPELTSIETSNLQYEDVDVQITNTIVVSDPDDVVLDSALIVISENFKTAEDSLIYTTLFGITGTWNSTTGVLKLEGNNSLSDYQDALRSIKYSNTATIASGPERVVSFIVSDGALKSDSTKRTIDVSPVETIPNLEVWLRADLGISEGDGVAVTTWEDQSGNGNDFVGTAGSGTAPVFESSSATLNSQPSVIFAGNGDYFEDSDGDVNYIDNATEFSLFVVLKSDVTGTDRGLFNTQVPDNDDKTLTIRYDASGANGAGAFTNVVKTGILANSADNQLESFSDIQTTGSQIISLQWDSGLLYDLYVDGILNNPSSAADPPPSGTISAAAATTAILGKGGKDDPNVSNQSWDGEIAEFIYYSRSLTDEERESVEDYLSEKYDVPIRKITPATGGEAISADDANTTFTSLSGPFIQEGFIKELTFGGTIILNAPSGFEWNTSGTYGVTVTPAYGGTTALAASFTSATSSLLTFTIDDTSTSASNPGQLEFTGLEIRPTTGVLPNTGNITNSGSTGQGGATNFGTITMVAGVKDSLSFIVQPSATNVDSTVSPPVRVQLVDQFGNSVEEASVSITVALSSGSGALTGSNTEVSNSLGIAEFDSVIVNTIGTKELEATSAGLSADTSSTFEIVNAGTLTSFLVERAPSGSISSKTAGQTFNIKLTALDGTATTVTTFNGTVVVSSSCTMGTGQGTTSNFSSGELSSLTVSLTSVGVCDITVTNSSGPETGTSNTFTVTAGAADETVSTITASPTVILNDGASTSILTVQLIDTYGNNLTTGGSTVVLSATAGTLTLGGSGATDNGDGTYVDTLTSSTSIVTSTITGTVDAASITDDAEVEFAAFSHIWESQLGSASVAADWEDTGNWNVGTLPGSSSIILIPASPAVGNEFPVIDEAGATVTSVSMETGASLTISGGINFTITGDLSGGSVLGTNADSLTIGGDVLNVSTINVGTVILNGSTAQAITDPHSYTNLEIDNSSGVSIEQNLTISDTLRLTDGELLIPSGVNVVAGGIAYGSGSFRFQREITGSRGWRILSSPVSSTYGDFLDGILTQGYSGAFYSTGGNPGDTLQPNVLTYLESFAGTDNQRYRAPTSSAQSLTAGQGMFVFIFDTIAADVLYNDALPDTIDVSGQEFPASGNEVNFNITYTTAADSGWNLVGNPFGATIDWDDSPNWTKTNVESTIYVWDPAANGGNGEYLTWNGTTGTLGSGLIAPFQGFWVKANASSPDLRVTTDAKTTGGTFLRKEFLEFEDPPTFSLKLTSGELEKQTVFMFSEDASVNKDNFDAFELAPFSTTRLEIFSTLPNGTSLAINNLPAELRNRYLIPIHINGYKEGVPIKDNFELRAVNADDIPDEWLVLLIDNETGNEINLLDQEVFEFFHTTAKRFKPLSPLEMDTPVQIAREKARFTLKITTEEIEASIPQAIFLEQNYPNPFNPSTTINFGLDIDAYVTLEVFDILGRKVQTIVDESLNAGTYSRTFDARSLASGIYIYRLSTQNKVVTRRMTLIK